MPIKLSITAEKENEKTLKKLAGAPKEALSDISKLVAKAALNISNNAKRRIAKGPKTGHVYEWEAALKGEESALVDDETGKLFFILGFPVKMRAKPHRASAPGESPATDRGTLLNSIISRSKELSAEAGSNVLYAPYLEFGTTGMEPRPFLQPAIEEEWPKSKEEITAAVQRAIEA